MQLGPRFFPARSSDRHRRRRQIFAGVFVLVGLALVWPIYPYFASSRLIFGLPLSLLWIVLMLGAMFAAMMWLFLGEEDRERR